MIYVTDLFFKRRIINADLIDYRKQLLVILQTNNINLSKRHYESFV